MSSETFKVTTHVFPGQHIRQYAGATRNREEDTQYLEAKQYTPLTNLEPKGGDVTILSTCAVSFPKEMYEPFFDELLAKFGSRGLRIRSIWSVDKSDHGASGILNEHTQGDDPSASDFARDILNMINIFRDQMTLPLVGIGHSMGGTTLFELSLIHPRLFSSLIVVDPIVGFHSYQSGYPLVYAASRKQDLWRSREEVEKTFRSAKPLKRWDPRVMELWLKYGFRETPTLLYPEPGKVTTRTTKANESWSYSRGWFDPLPKDNTERTNRSRIKYPDTDVSNASVRELHPFDCPECMYVWDRLPDIRIPVLWVFPGSSATSTEDMMAQKVAQTGTGKLGSGGEKARMTSKTVIEHCGHLVAFEKPKECAEVAARCIEGSLKTWEERRRYERENRDDKSINKIALSEEWKRQAKKWYDGWRASQSKL